MATTLSIGATPSTMWIGPSTTFTNSGSNPLLMSQTNPASPGAGGAGASIAPGVTFDGSVAGTAIGSRWIWSPGGTTISVNV